LKQQNNRSESNQLVNEQIRYPKIKLISNDGQNMGIMTRDEALRMARSAELDLVLVADKSAEGVPIAKIMDFGKLIYAKKKKQAEAKKHQKTVQVKEIKMRPKIGEHDYQTKLKQAIQFLRDGKYVKITLVFRGREAAASQERGSQMFEKIGQAFEEEGLGMVIIDKEAKTNSLWSRIYFVKK
jgi:translation initiation factor IF-3